MKPKAVCVLAYFLAAVLLSGCVVVTEDTPEMVDVESVQVAPRENSALITWTGNSPGYLIEIADSEDFAMPTQHETEQPSLTLSGLQPGTTYYVRVYNVTLSGLLSPASPVMQFTTEDSRYPLPAPELKTKVTSFSSIQTNWELVGQDLTYLLEIAKDANFTTVTKRTTTAKKLSFSKLKAGRTYYIRARLVDGTGTEMSDWSATATATIPKKAGLRVASYNVFCASCTMKGDASWEKRRDGVIANILAQDPDIIGLQEVNRTYVSTNGTREPQYLDLLHRLGSPYRYADQNPSVSRDNRILYNSERLQLDDAGMEQIPGRDYRPLVWAKVTQLATGMQFYFVNLHLEPGNDAKDDKANKKTALRRQQATAAVEIIKELNTEGLPVIVVGDLNSSRTEYPSNTPYNVLTAAGYLDPLGNSTKNGRAVDAFVETRIHTEYNSYNWFRRKPPKSKTVNGANIDYILVTPMQVSEFETVVNVNSKGELVGQIPSDHNMLRATVWLLPQAPEGEEAPEEASQEAVEKSVGKKLLTLKAPEEFTGKQSGGLYNAQNFSFSPDGRYVYVVYNDASDHIISLLRYARATGAFEQRVTLPKDIGHGTMFLFEYAGDTVSVWSGGADGTEYAKSDAKYGPDNLPYLFHVTDVFGKQTLTRYTMPSGYEGAYLVNAGSGADAQIGLVKRCKKQLSCEMKTYFVSDLVDDAGGQRRDLPEVSLEKVQTFELQYPDTGTHAKEFLQIGQPYSEYTEQGMAWDGERLYIATGMEQTNKYLLKLALDVDIYEVAGLEARTKISGEPEGIVISGGTLYSGVRTGATGSDSLAFVIYSRTLT